MPSQPLHSTLPGLSGCPPSQQHDAVWLDRSRAEPPMQACQRVGGRGEQPGAEGLLVPTARLPVRPRPTDRALPQNSAAAVRGERCLPSCLGRPKPPPSFQTPVCTSVAMGRKSDNVERAPRIYIRTDGVHEREGRNIEREGRTGEGEREKGSHVVWPSERCASARRTLTDERCYYYRLRHDTTTTVYTTTMLRTKHIEDKEAALRKCLVVAHVHIKAKAIDRAGQSGKRSTSLTHIGRTGNVSCTCASFLKKCTTF